MSLQWYRVSDNHSGGGRNTPYEYYQIQAPSEQFAIAAWEAYTGHGIGEVACACCGPSFSIYDIDDGDLFDDSDWGILLRAEDVLTLDWATIIATD